MRIVNYQLDLKSSSKQEITESEQTSLRVWSDASDSGKAGNISKAVLLDLSDEGKRLAYQTAGDADSVQKSGPSGDSQEDMPDEIDLKQHLLSEFIYILTGKRMKFFRLKLKDPDASSSTPADPNNQVQARAGWGINFNYQHTYSETSSISFSAKGMVKTADGREIELDFKLNMSRSFSSSTNISFKAGDALLDPLVINLGTTPASLSARKISFDINIDGNKEDISLPNSGSGFLVLDKNNSGSVDDGSELFGPQSGNGFAELSQYDWDKNGWIDENDPIYDNLQIWQHDDSGNPSLIALGQAGVGAIFLGSTQTDFKYADNQNNTQGMLRQTGIYLHENGTAGTIQHVDLAI